MAKSSKNAPAAKTAAAPAPQTAPAEEVKVPLSKMRGPKGVKEDAKITVLTDGGRNPKRDGSKASRVFAKYSTGMSVGAFCDAVDAEEDLKGSATPNLVYDSKHGFISIEGYDPGEIVAPKPKAEAQPKPAKAEGKRSKKATSSDAPAPAAADAEAKEEVMD